MPNISPVPIEQDRSMISTISAGIVTESNPQISLETTTVTSVQREAFFHQRSQNAIRTLNLMLYVLKACMANVQDIPPLREDNYADLDISNTYQRMYRLIYASPETKPQ